MDQRPKSSDILITGAKGLIGQVLQSNLSEPLIAGDLPELDVRDKPKLYRVARNARAIIHLAWNTKADNWRSNYHDPDNFKMAQNVYEVAFRSFIDRVIIASSVHADFPKLIGSPRTIYDEPQPDSPYGQAKVAIEELGRVYAEAGLPVVCIRFGGVNRHDQPAPHGHPDRSVWLSQADCVSVVQQALTIEAIPNNFAIVNAVSSSSAQTHSNTNAIGWSPQTQTI